MSRSLLGNHKTIKTKATRLGSQLELRLESKLATKTRSYKKRQLFPKWKQFKMRIAEISSLFIESV